MVKISRFVFPLVLMFFVLTYVLTSCSGKLGYGVVTWSMPENNLSAGDIVPVYVRSNIGKVYIAAVNEKTKERIEIPLWQLDFYETKRAAFAMQQKIIDRRFDYARVQFDGLPMRIEADNSSKQVYRLKKNQEIKILRQGKGAPVLKGGKPMNGEWFEVMTRDGTRGWCFSYHLEIYDERGGAEAQNAYYDSKEKNAEISDKALHKVLNSFWYPEYYRTMLNARQVDLERVSASYGFFPGAQSNIARIDLKDLQLSFPYSKITEINGKYSFEDTNLYMHIRGEDTVILEFTDKNGRQCMETFITLNTSAEEIIEREKARRSKLMEKLQGSFSSGNYGILKILEEDKFLWSGYKLISPSIIPKGAGSAGSLSLKYFISKKLKTAYNGVLSFQFENSEEEINFLYDISSEGLRLEFAENSNIKDGVVQRKSLNPVILFFAKDKN